MSDKLKVVGAKALDLVASPRLARPALVEGPPRTVPDPSWDACGLDLVEVQQSIRSEACVNFPDAHEADSKDDPMFLNLISRQG